MSVGSVNTPGASGRERKQAEKALLARMESVEKTLSGNKKIPGISDPTAQVTATVGQIYINIITGEEWKCVAVNDSGSVWEKQTKSSVGLTAADIGAAPANHSHTAADVGAAPENHSHTASDLGIKIFSAGKTAPTDKSLLWIDTTATTGGLKYHNGTAWVHVPVSTT